MSKSMAYDLAHITGQPREEVRKLLLGFYKMIIESLIDGEVVEITGFGRFQLCKILDYLTTHTNKKDRYYIRFRNAKVLREKLRIVLFADEI